MRLVYDGHRFYNLRYLITAEPIPPPSGGTGKPTLLVTMAPGDTYKLESPQSEAMLAHLHGVATPPPDTMQAERAADLSSSPSAPPAAIYGRDVAVDDDSPVDPEGGDDPAIKTPDTPDLATACSAPDGPVRINP